MQSFGLRYSYAVILYDLRRMLSRKYILGTLLACIATIVAGFGFGFLIGYQSIQGTLMRILEYTLLAAFGIGWVTLMITLASVAAGPWLRTLSEEQMMKMNIPMMMFWREVFDHIPKREADRNA